MKIELADAYALLHEADQAMSVLEGVDWEDPNTWKNTKDPANRREHKARISRDLLNLQHKLQAAATEVGNVYWQGKGY